MQQVSCLSRFSDLYFDFESLKNGSLVGSIRGRHVTSATDAGDFTATFTGRPEVSQFSVDMTAQKLRLLILLVILIKSLMRLKPWHGVWSCWN